MVNHQLAMGPFHGDNCAQCNIKLSSYKDYINHVQECHQNIWKFKCGICNNLFDTKKDRLAHKVKIHKVENKKKMFCDICGGLYANLKVSIIKPHKFILFLYCVLYLFF